MSTFAVILTVVLAVMSAASAFATATGVAQVRDNLLSVGVPESRYRLLAIPKGAAALGLLIGLAATGLAVAAAVGLVVYFVLAVGAHLRASHRDARLAPPLVFLVVAVVTLIALVAS